MQINPGMLIFALLDSGIAFLLVFFVTRSKFGGAKSTLARTLGAILGTLVFIFYFAAIVWFNTERHTISDAGKMVVYAAPIVLIGRFAAVVGVISAGRIFGGAIN